jgi:5-methylcytosine-specific restriction endonuclease McrA
MYLGGMHPDGPTLGHIIPAAQGGTDEDANLGLEHRRCNLAAGPRPTPPRALIAHPVTIE